MDRIRNPGNLIPSGKDRDVWKVTIALCQALASPILADGRVFCLYWCMIARFAAISRGYGMAIKAVELVQFLHSAKTVKLTDLAADDNEHRRVCLRKEDTLKEKRGQLWAGSACGAAWDGC